jgi:protein-tyrosine-phosphatase
LNEVSACHPNAQIPDDGHRDLGIDVIRSPAPEESNPHHDDPDPVDLAAPEATREAGSRARGVSRKRILLVCGGNTCRSPMAKAILEEKLKDLGRSEEFEVDSAASSAVTTSLKASDESRVTMVVLYGKDLLASHESKGLNPELIEQADLILAMAPAMKEGLPAEKTFTLKEYAWETGTIADPFGSDRRLYLRTALEISRTLDRILLRLLSL